ncbi:peptidoglycan-binding domain-containing protein [Bacillus sp. NEAU-CP5]|uniref:peptidoglycan-binding domain-containing protein n=1 Tax=Bacillus TaxID=1386 RepID=UPI0021D4286F|nr:MULTISPECIES: peptidoglycan-binding domain-containing protein [Bacillus]MCX3305371.1 peptidoglycan-binding domain-containing protein [Bacillus velezensis]MCX8439971.1 peptidoglycan-binding domain-containing protein [Bacillus sp. NEAU-CP5]
MSQSPSRDEEGFSAIYLNSLTSVNESVSIDERFDEDIYGPKTANAVKRFQSMYGLTADGIYGPKTKMKISVKETRKIR